MPGGALLDAESITPASPTDLAATALAAATGPFVVLSSVPSFGSRRLKHVAIATIVAPSALLATGLIKRSELTELVGACGEGAVQGGWDAVFTSGWSVAWAELDGFMVWAPDQVVARASATGLTVRGEPIAIGDVDHVEVFASADRVRRGVRIARFEQDPLEILVHEVPVAGQTIHLDHMDLKQELLWAQALGRNLARALSRPFFDTV